jgi:hypothetical protein
MDSVLKGRYLNNRGCKLTEDEKEQKEPRKGFNISILK